METRFVVKGSGLFRIVRQRVLVFVSYRPPASTAMTVAGSYGIAGLTGVVSMANCVPPQRGKPLAMTLMRPSSMFSVNLFFCHSLTFTCLASSLA